MISPRRFKEWLRVAFGPRVKPSDWWTIAKSAFSLIFNRVNGDTWRNRMRACYGCPVFNHDRKICEGCGCSAPYSNLLDKPECWGRTEIGEEFGWGPEKKA